MNSKNLICPACRNQFEFALDDTVFSGNITCPRCEVNLKSAEFDEMIFCPLCRSAVKIPLAAPEERIAECPHCSAKLHPDASERSPWLKEGDFFDKYRIISRVGKGGMSEVYKAEHLLLKHIYALKILRNDRSQEFPMMYKRFLREGKCFHELEHTNIVRVFEIGCDVKTGYLFIAMEYLENGTLAENLEKPMDERELLKVASDITNALIELEKRGIIHRDIKPSNIMCDADGHYKLMDLGIAKHGDTSKNDYTLTIDQSIFGTPTYASPEQCESPHDVDCRSDIYSLGATLYHLGCGKPPFDGKSPLGIVVNVMGEAPPPLKPRAPHLSAAFIKLIEQMMEKSASQRPANAAALAAQISEVKLRIDGRFRRKHHIMRTLATAALPLLIISGIVWISRITPETEKTVPPPQMKQSDVSPAGKVNSELDKFIRSLAAEPDLSTWRNPPGADWHLHLAQALREARTLKRNLLILVHREHKLPAKWRNERFLHSLRRRYILMFCECSSNGIPPEQSRHIDELRRILGLKNSSPAIAVLSPEGKLLRTSWNINQL